MAFYLKIQTHQDAKSLMVQRWLIEEGQYIDRLRPIVVIRADDEQVTIRAQRDGILLGKYVQDGESFERDDELATIISPEEAGRIKITRTLTARDREILNSLNRKPKHKHPHADHLRATPAARSLASQYGVSLFDVHGSGPDGRIQKSDVLRYVRAGEEDIKDKNQRVLKLAGKDTGSDEQSDQPTKRLKKVRISPLARKMAVSYGIDLKDVKSHGGKIGKEDVLDFLGLLTPAESASLAPEDTAQAQNTVASESQPETVSTPQVEAVLEEAVLDEGPIDLTRLRQQAEADDIRTLQEAGRLESEDETEESEGPDEVDLAAEALRQEESRKLFDFFSRIAKDADGELMAVPTEVDKIKVAGQNEVPEETAPEAGRVEEAEIVAHEAEMEALEPESESGSEAPEAPLEETSEDEAISAQAEEVPPEESEKVSEEASEDSSDDLFGDLTVALSDDMTEDESENDHEEQAEKTDQTRSETESDMHETTSQIKDDIRTEESRLLEELLAFARSQSTSVGMGGGGSAKTAEPGAQSEETKEEPEAAAQESEAQETGFVLKDSVDETKAVTEPSAEEAPAEEMNPSEAKEAAESESSDEPMLYLAPEGEFAYDGLHYNNLDEREALLSTSLFDLLGTPEADTIQIPDTDSIIELTGEMPEHALSEQAQMQEGPSEPKAHVDTPDVIALPQEPETETTEIHTEDTEAQEAEDALTESIITPAPPAHEPDMDTMADRAIHAALAEPALFEDEDADIIEKKEQAEKPEHHPEVSYDDLLYGSVEDTESESGQVAKDVIDFMSEELPDVTSEPDAGEILRGEILAALGLTGAEAEEVLELSTVEDGGLFEAAYARSAGTKAREQAYEALTTSRPVPSETLTLSAEMRLDPIFSILEALETDPGHTLTYEPEDFILLSIRRALEAMTGEVLPILFQDVEQIYAVATSAQDLTSIHEALEACTPGSAKSPVTVVSLLATPVITASGAQKTMSPLVLTIGGLRTATSADGKTHHYARMNLETTALSLTQAGKLLQDILSALDYPSTMLIEKA